MGLLQEGNGIPFLAPPVFQYLCGTSAEISIEDSPHTGGQIVSTIGKCTVHDCTCTFRYNYALLFCGKHPCFILSILLIIANYDLLSLNDLL